jgi:hypothetical protein
LWLQGETNLQINDQAAYECIFPLLISSWRQLFNVPDAPFAFIQYTAENEAIYATDMYPISSSFFFFFFFFIEEIREGGVWEKKIGGWKPKIKRWPNAAQLLGLPQVYKKKRKEKKNREK